MSMLGKVAVVIAALGASAGCYVEPSYAGPAYAGTYDNTGVDTSYATDGYTDPPPEYVATTQPVYYGGRASYYYGNAWRYRESGRWNTYRSEPGGLRQYRSQRSGYSAPTRRYEGARGGGGVHNAGGWHGRHR